MDLGRIYDLHRTLPDAAASYLHRRSGGLARLLALHLASRLAVSARHAWRPVIDFPGRGYFYDRNALAFDLPGVRLRPEELAMLLVVDHIVKQMLLGPLHEQVRYLRKKLCELLGAGLPARCRFPSHRVRILPAHARRIDGNQLTLAAAGVVERRQLAFAYAGRTGGHRHRANRLAAMPSLLPRD